ncbi:MAG TPA: response regulator transcription factor [Actinomycetes bacterium]|nr:response regulator transcription factor [Actinomycetes bacterium]
MTTVVIADDHPLFLDGLAALLASASDIEVIGRAVTANEAIDTVSALLPDVAVLDLNMPGPGGIATIREIVRRVDSVRILVLTMYDDDSLVFEAVRAGASGYVLKGADPEEVISAVRAVAHGEAVFGAGLARRLADWFDRSQQDPFEQLTPREREVLELIARGVRNAAIAQRLGISLKTVRNLVSSVLTKLQVPDREAASQRARQAGLGPSPGQRPEVGGTLGH